MSLLVAHLSAEPNISTPLLASILQYTTKSKQTRVLKNIEFKREVGIDIKSKETAITHHPCSIVYCMYLLKYRIAAG